MPADTAQRHVLCMKWGTKYGPEYVNTLYAMVRRNLRGDFRFVCLTDDARGIRPEVECLPIPEMDIRPEAPGVRDRAWRKLTTFSADLHGLRGRDAADGGAVLDAFELGGHEPALPHNIVISEAPLC